MSHPVTILFGLETEVGIWRERSEDVVADSIALVRSASESGVWMRWDYRHEDPHADVRGFRAGELRQDVDEAGYLELDTRRALSHAEIKSDLVLPNGGRFYNDHAHPEYCTPECLDPDELVAQDRAGDQMLMRCAAALSQRLRDPVRLYKNNTDFRGHSYGCHENYLVPRALPWENLARAAEAFLVTRQIYAGAGKFGCEAEDRWIGPGFQISQRSDFFLERQSVDTMQRRPIINTRDEPHANPHRFRRFHVIVGDANMSPWATWLKCGASALVWEAIAAEPGRDWPALQDPLAAIRGISQDSSFRWRLDLEGGRMTTAIEVQREYWRAVRERIELNQPWKERVMAEWRRVLDDLEIDYSRCRGRIDWVTKLDLVREFQAREGLADDDPWLQSLDLEYHRLDAQEGLYYGLEAAGAMERVAQPAGTSPGMRAAPTETRAAVRGLCVGKFGARVRSASWSQVTLEAAGEPVRISLLDLFETRDIVRLISLIEASASPDELREKLSMGMNREHSN